MKLNNIDYHICDTCNLNCSSCNHYSPLAENPNMITLSKAKDDFELLKKFDDKFDKITILGGEACLNPDLLPIIELSLQYFPDRVKLITNGTITGRLYELRERNLDLAIELVITEYPFIKNYREHYDKLKEEFPNATFYTFRHEHGFISEHLSYEETNTNTDLILNCEKRFKFVQFIDGKLYICHYVAFIDNLKRIANFNFGKEDAFIDLTKCSGEEFDNFFTNAIPNICKHCKFVQKPYEELDKKPWSRTKKEPTEWIL